MVATERFAVSTRGHTDIIDISDRVREAVAKSGLKSGIATVFVSGSTAGITTTEYEPGLLKDLPEAFERVAPTGRTYHHDSTWGDGNGYAHVRASLLGASFTVPFQNGELLLGTWQQIVLVDFDNRPRTRTLIVQLVGE
ncbi:MAG: secondary thiamine-phosphate synthase enzyme YjbQ [Bacteroidota bacterium]